MAQFKAFIVLLLWLPLASYAYLPSSQIIISKLNSERGIYGLSTLAEDPRLMKAAEDKAFELAKFGNLVHSVSVIGVPWSIIDKNGYKYRYIGENLAVNILTEDEIVKYWMQSSSHRENILNSSFKDVGVGVAVGKYMGEDSAYVVAYFADPKVTLEPKPPTSTVTDDKQTQIDLIKQLISLLMQYLKILQGNQL